MVSAFEWLKSKTKEQKRDSWIALGQQEAKNSIPVYAKDIIYKVTENDSPLNGCLILAKETYRVTGDFPKIDWKDYYFSPDDEFGIIDDLNIQSPFFALILSKEDLDNLSSTPINDIIPYEENADDEKFESVIIPDIYYKQILSKAGYPFLRPEELEVERQHVIELCIEPALREYFRWFPIVKEEIIGSSTHFVWDFPPFCFGILDLAQTLDASTTEGNTYGNGAFYLTRTEGVYGSGFGIGNRFGNVFHRKPVAGFTGRTLFDTGIAGYINHRAYRQGVSNLHRRIKYTKIVKQDGSLALEVNAQSSGKVSAWLAFRSNDFRLVEYNRLNELIELCGAKLKTLLFIAREHVKTDIAGQLNTSWLKEAEETIKKIVDETWKKNSLHKRFAIMRDGSF